MATSYSEFDRIVDEALQSLQVYEQNPPIIEPVNHVGVVESTSDGTQKKKKRNRTIFTPYQLATLQREYSQRKYLDKISRQNMAKHLGLTDRQIKVWFQNKRMKEKKNPPPEQSLVPPAPQPQQPNFYGTEAQNYQNWYMNNSNFFYQDPQQNVPYPNSFNGQYPSCMYSWGNMQTPHYN